jgi:hypothetical protein
LVPQDLNKTLTALILAFAYILLLVHNLVPHQHESDADTPVHHAAADHHHHDQEHGHDHDGQEAPAKSNPDPDHFLSQHQHSFADNKIHHVDTQSEVKVSKRQVLPVLVCFLSFHHYLFRVRDPEPDPRAFEFPPTNYSCRSHALRGPPVA